MRSKQDILVPPGAPTYRGTDRPTLAAFAQTRKALAELSERARPLPAIADASGDVQTKFNALLAAMREAGWMKET